MFKVTDRRTNAPSDPAAVSNISQSQLITIGERLLQPDAETLGVRVNPRYGVWDPIQLRVVAEGSRRAWSCHRRQRLPPLPAPPTAG